MGLIKESKLMYGGCGLFLFMISIGSILHEFNNIVYSFMGLVVSSMAIVLGFYMVYRKRRSVVENDDEMSIYNRNQAKVKAITFIESKFVMLGLIFMFIGSNIRIYSMTGTVLFGQSGYDMVFTIISSTIFVMLGVYNLLVWYYFNKSESEKEVYDDLEDDI